VIDAERQQRPRRTFHRFGVVAGTVALTLLFFLVLPLMQAIAKPRSEALLLQSFDTANLPPPPPPPPPQEPEDEPEPEEQPPELAEDATPPTAPPAETLAETQAEEVRPAVLVADARRPRGGRDRPPGGDRTARIGRGSRGRSPAAGRAMQQSPRRCSGRR